MANENTTEATATNGTPAAAPKGPKNPKLEALHKQYLANGGKPPAAKEAKKLIDAFLKAEKAKHDAEAAVEAAKLAEYAAVEAIILNFGKSRKRIGGEMRIPMEKGDTVFFRGEGKGEIQDLDG